METPMGRVSHKVKTGKVPGRGKEEKIKDKRQGNSP